MEKRGEGNGVCGIDTGGQLPIIERALDGGAVAVSTVGEGCDVLENTFEMEMCYRNPELVNERLMIPTYQHGLREGVFGFLSCLLIPEAFESEWRAGLALTIGNPRVYRCIARLLATTPRIELRHMNECRFPLET